ERWQAPKSWRLDYSPVALPNLDEAHLNENNGLGVPAGIWPVVAIPYLNGQKLHRYARLEHGAKVDWSGDGTFSADDSADINNITYDTFNCQRLLNLATNPGDMLKGWSDWTTIIYNFRNSVAFDSTIDECNGP